MLPVHKVRLDPIQCNGNAHAFCPFILTHTYDACSSHLISFYSWTATYISECVGKKHRSRITSYMAGLSRSLGLAFGPIVAAVLVFVDFDIGK